MSNRKQSNKNDKRTCLNCAFSETSKKSSSIYCEKKCILMSKPVEDCYKWEKKTIFSGLFKK